MKLGSASRVPGNSKKKKKSISVQTLALISSSILTLASHQTKRGSCCFGSGRCSMDSAASCGRLSSLSDEALTWERVMRLILTLISSVLPSQAACKREPCSVQAPFFNQLPDCTVVVHPKERFKRMWGRRRKSPGSHSHTDGFHMEFLVKSTSGSFHSNYCQQSAAALT